MVTRASATPYTETEALLLALAGDREDELREYLEGHFTASELAGLAMAAARLECAAWQARTRLPYTASQDGGQP